MPPMGTCETSRLRGARPQDAVRRLVDRGRAHVRHGERRCAPDSQQEPARRSRRVNSRRRNPLTIDGSRDGMVRKPWDHKTAWSRNKPAGDKSRVARRQPGRQARPRRGREPRRDSRHRRNHRRNSQVLRSPLRPRHLGRSSRTRTPEHVPAKRPESSNRPPRSPLSTMIFRSLSWLMFLSVDFPMFTPVHET
jgi:hypothetical protein